MILPTVVMDDEEDKSQEGYCEGASIPIPDMKTKTSRESGKSTTTLRKYGWTSPPALFQS
jgi:hypothetical protein